VSTQHALDEVRNLRDQLQRENVYLQQEVKAGRGHVHLIGGSAALRNVLEQVDQVAVTTSTVLLIGETGTGKELVASAIHDSSPRVARPMIRVNCAAIPETLIESELFGREKGAYTGALSRQVGRFEVAHGSTLFLDEVGELPHAVQVKLLRVLQEKQIERLGSSKPISVDVRIIAATNRDLEAAVRENKFRADLYYRLNVFPIKIPPLRERTEDIRPLIESFVHEFAKAFRKTIESIDKRSIDVLRIYEWPGNIRELRNTVERAVILANGPRLHISAPKPPTNGTTISLVMEDIEREHLRKVLEMTGWRIRGKDGAAEILDVKPTTLESRIAKLNLLRKNAIN
jgi:transcriptional regulator with GAF, ATPase, and Fis domain